MRRVDAAWLGAGMVALAIVATLMLATVSGYGLTWDAEFHNTYGEYVLAWYESGFQDTRSLTYRNAYVYGALFDVLALQFARLSPLGLYEDRHLVNVIFGILAFVGTWRLGTLLLGARGGAIALVFAVLTPALYGHAFNNPKDLPFAALFVWALHYLYQSARGLPEVPRRATAMLAICVGTMLAVRPGGIFFAVYVLVWWSIVLWRRGASRKQAWRALLALVLALAVAWVIMLSCWPWGQVNPIAHPLAAMAYASRFSYAMTTLFLGEQVSAQHPPLAYLPVLFAVKLPETYLVAALAGLAGYVYRRRHQEAENMTSGSSGGEIVLLAFVVSFPLLIAVGLRSTLYDGLRHVLFVMPPLAVMAAAALEYGLGPGVPARIRAAIAGSVILAACGTALDMVVLHPYQSTYFNRLIAGGLAGAQGAFETDYWGTSYREAVEWVVENIQGQDVTIANCSSPLLSDYYVRGAGDQGFIPAGTDTKVDIFLATTRWDCHLGVDGRLVHLIERQGVPLAYVFDRRSLPVPRSN